MANAVYTVLGATGTTGSRVAAELRRANQRVRTASRRSAGPDGVRFDWGRPETWGPAVAGSTGLYLMAPDGVDVDPALIGEATDAGVRKIVLLSSSAVEEMQDERLLAAERLVRGSGAEWTVLRPSWFDQNFDEGFFHPAVMEGEVLMPLGGVRQAFVDAGDIARVAAAALLEEGHADRTYEVRGPEALGFEQAVAEISGASGRPVRYNGDPQAWLAAQLRDGLPAEAVRGALAAFEALARRGDDQPNDVVERVTGRPPTPFANYAEAAAAAGAWR